METHDPWLAELVRRADALDFEETPETNNDDLNDKIEALTDMICRAGDEPEIKSAALLLLMARIAQR